MDYLGGLSEMNGLGSRYESDLGNMANGIQSAGATYAYQLKSVADQAKQAVDNLKAWGTDTGVELGGALAYKGLYAGSALQASIGEMATTLKGTVQEGVSNAFASAKSAVGDAVGTAKDALGDAVSSFYGFKPVAPVEDEMGAELDTFQTFARRPMTADPTGADAPQLSTAPKQPTGADNTSKLEAGDEADATAVTGEEGGAAAVGGEAVAGTVAKTAGETIGEVAVDTAPLDDTGIGEVILAGTVVYEGIKDLFDFFDRPKKSSVSIPDVASMITPSASTFISTAVQSGAD
jgi:hypothetical protein